MPQCREQRRSNEGRMILGSHSAEPDDIKRPHLDPRAELLDAGFGPIRWGWGAPPILRMDDARIARLAARRFTRDRRALVWSLARSPAEQLFETLRDQIERLGPRSGHSRLSVYLSAGLVVSALEPT